MQHLVMNTIPDIAYLILAYLVEPDYEFVGSDNKIPVLRYCDNSRAAYQIIKYFKTQQIKKSELDKLSKNPSPRIIRLLRNKNLHLINPLYLVANSTKDSDTIQWIYTYCLNYLKRNTSAHGRMLSNSRNMDFTLYCLSRPDIINRYRKLDGIYNPPLSLFELIRNFPTKEFALKLVEITKSHGIYDQNELREIVSRQRKLISWLVDDPELIDWNIIIHNRDPELYLMAFSVAGLIVYDPPNHIYQKLYTLFLAHYIGNLQQLINNLMEGALFSIIFCDIFDYTSVEGLDIMKQFVECDVINRAELTKLFNKQYRDSNDIFINKFGPRLVRAVYRKI